MSFWRTILRTATELILPEEAKIKRLTVLSLGEIRNRLPKAERTPDRELFSLFSYRNPEVHTLVWAVKYKNHPLLLEKAGALLYEEIIAVTEDARLFEDKNKIALIPIPMTRAAEKERGWNQAEELCKAVISESKQQGNHFFFFLPLLEKVKQTKHQRNLAREERLKNVKESMSLKNPLKNTKEKYKDFIFIIVDDVSTTGATIEEARRALKKISRAGPRTLAITLAH